MAKKIGAAEVEKILTRARPELIRRREEAGEQAQSAIKAMSEEVERRRETLAHHLLDLPLWSVLYFWLILRLKYRPWRVLVPASFLAVLIYRLVGGTIPNLWTILRGGLVP